MAFDFEQTVRCNDPDEAEKNRKKYIFLRNFSAVGAGVAVVGIAVSLSGLLYAGIAVALAGALPALICFLRKDRCLVEYDYLLGEDSISFARVLNASKRKELGSFRLSSLRAFGRWGDARLNGWRAQGAQEIDCCCNAPAQRWFLYTGDTLIYFEPNDQIAQALRKCVKE